MTGFIIFFRSGKVTRFGDPDPRSPFPTTDLLQSKNDDGRAPGTMPLKFLHHADICNKLAGYALSDG